MISAATKQQWPSHQAIMPNRHTFHFKPASIKRWRLRIAATLQYSQITPSSVPAHSRVQCPSWRPSRAPWSSPTAVPSPAPTGLPSTVPTMIFAYSYVIISANRCAIMNTIKMLDSKTIQVAISYTINVKPLQDWRCSYVSCFCRSAKIQGCCGKNGTSICKYGTIFASLCIGRCQSNCRAVVVLNIARRDLVRTRLEMLVNILFKSMAYYLVGSSWWLVVGFYFLPEEDTFISSWRSGVELDHDDGS